nr:helix-turn-helix domain-containing protein [Candidatus Sigynarchaeota archaeon]
MRVLKIKIPSRTLLDLGLPNYFNVVDSIEVLQIYQYDRNNFFSLHKILFKPGTIEALDRHLRVLFHAQSFQVLETKGNEVLCIMKQRKTTGFWPALLSGSWALIAPINIDHDAVVFSVIAKEDAQLNAILNQLKMFKSIKLLAISKPDDMAGNAVNAMPRLTNRQREIMTFAARHGYFEVPKQVSTQQIAEHFQISPSAVINHVQKAEKAIMKTLFG